MLTMKRLYELASEWKEARIKTENNGWHYVIESDFWVVMKFLKYVWAHEDDGEEEK